MSVVDDGELGLADVATWFAGRLRRPKSERSEASF
jgi:hypothetical protein